MWEKQIHTVLGEACVDSPRCGSRGLFGSKGNEVQRDRLTKDSSDHGRLVISNQKAKIAWNYLVGRREQKQRNHDPSLNTLYSVVDVYSYATALVVKVGQVQ